MFLGFENTKISNNRKLLSHSNFYFLGGGNLPLHFEPLQNHLILLSFGKRGDTVHGIQGESV